MCITAPAATCGLPNSLQAPALAREFARLFLCRRHGAGSEDTLVLATSELVTNAVVDGAPPITATISCDGSSIRVSVSDAAPEIRGASSERVAASLALVDLVAVEWGADEDGAGRAVWCRLAAIPFLTHPSHSPVPVSECPSPGRNRGLRVVRPGGDLAKPFARGSRTPARRSPAANTSSGQVLAFRAR